MVITEKYKRISILAFSILFLIISACKTTSPDIERGNSYIFGSGTPEIRMSAIGIITEEDEPVINVATEIVFNSLVFKNENNLRTAKITVEIKAVNKSTGYSETITELVDITNDPTVDNLQGDTYNFKREIPVQPGEYEVAVSVTDNYSLKSIAQVTDTYIPDPANPDINVTGILMQAKNVNAENPSYFPISTYDVPSRMDSIRFEFQVTNNESENPLTIRSRLIRFESDTTIAQPMSYNNPSSGSIIYKGVDMTEKEVIFSNTRQLTQPGSVYIEYLYQILPEGNYRFEVEATGNDDADFYKARDFSVKSDNYPFVKGVHEFAEPLKYLMSDSDYEELMSIEDPGAMKDAVDRFWLSNIKNPVIARNVIQLYYDRVERANKYFSSFKAGWKTDRGMIYILFGHPWYTEEPTTKNLLWSYSYSQNDFRSNFYFFKPKIQSRFYPFDHYLLQRDNDYFNVEYFQQQLWLTGQILEDNL